MNRNDEQTVRMDEDDWTVFRAVQRSAATRFCQRALENIRVASSGPAATAYERYQVIYRLVKLQDQELAALFDDARRSNAASRLIAMRTAGLVTDQEYAQFTPKLRDNIERASLGQSRHAAAALHGEGHATKCR